MILSRWQLGLLAALVVTVVACSGAPPEPGAMSVINQSNAAHTEVEAGNWCTNGLFSESCVAVDGPVTEVVAACGDSLVVALPETFTPQPGDHLGQFPAEGGGAWPVEVEEGAVRVNAEGSGAWSKASWTFDLTRSDAPC